MGGSLAADPISGAYIDFSASGVRDSTPHPDPDFEPGANTKRNEIPTMGRFSETSRTRQARFPRIGANVTGVVVDITDSAIPEFVDGRIVGPKFDVNGTMVTQTDVTVENENGKSIIHTRGGVAVAIALALVEAKSDDLAVGDTLSVTYESDEETDGDFAEKVYSATVTKPKSAKSAK